MLLCVVGTTDSIMIREMSTGIIIVEVLNREVPLYSMQFLSCCEVVSL